MRYKISLKEIKSPLEVYFTPQEIFVDSKEDWFFIKGEDEMISVALDTGYLEM